MSNGTIPIIKRPWGFQGAGGVMPYQGSRLLVDWVYPRMGEGNYARRLCLGMPGGLSPHGRGKREYPVRPGSSAGSIPTWAGETGISSSARFVRRVYPRMGGGNYALAAHAHAGSGLSPHGRGKLGRVRTNISRGGRRIWKTQSDGAATPQKRLILYLKIRSVNTP